MMISILSPLHAQAAVMRALGYAVSNQLRIAQIFARSAYNAPMAQVHALQAAASLPSEVTRAFVAVRAADAPTRVKTRAVAAVSPVEPEAAVPVVEAKDITPVAAPKAEKPAAAVVADVPVAAAPKAEKPAAAVVADVPVAAAP
ncbi:hypothetical protein SAMN04488239_1021, partial [Ruegeria marina]